MDILRIIIVVCSWAGILSATPNSTTASYAGTVVTFASTMMYDYINNVISAKDSGTHHGWKGWYNFFCFFYSVVFVLFFLVNAFGGFFIMNHGKLLFTQDYGISLYWIDAVLLAYPLVAAFEGMRGFVPSKVSGGVTQ